MRRTTRRFAVLGSVTALGLLSYAQFVARSDEARIRANLVELVESIAWDRATDTELARNRRIQDSFSRLLAASVVAKFLDLPAFEPGRGELALKTRFLSNRYDGLEVSVSDVSVEVNRRKRSAYLFGNATITMKQKGELHQHVRRFSVHWSNVDGNWQISAFDVQAPTHEEPEARP